MDDLKGELSVMRDRAAGKSQAAEDRLEEELGEYRYPEKAAAEEGFPRDTPRDLGLLNYYRDRKERIDSVIEIFEDGRSEALKEIIEDSEEEKSRCWDKDETEPAYLHDIVIRSIRNALHMAEGRGYERVPGGKKTGFPGTENIHSIEEIEENEELKAYRENKTHELLAASSLLEEKAKTLKGSTAVEEDDVTEAEEFEKELDPIIQELRKRASRLDKLLLRASLALEKLEEREK